MENFWFLLWLWGLLMPAPSIVDRVPQRVDGQQVQVVVFAPCRVVSPTLTVCS